MRKLVLITTARRRACGRRARDRARRRRQVRQRRERDLLGDDRQRLRRPATCTGSNGHVYATTKATYTGTATGPAELSGPITLDTESLVDTTSGDGTVSGRLRIDVDRRPRRRALRRASSTAARSPASPRVTPGARAPSSSRTSPDRSTPTTGFAAGGMIGGGTAAGYAVEVSPGGCKPPKPTPPPKPDRIEVHGAVSNVTTTSIIRRRRHLHHPGPTCRRGSTTSTSRTATRSRCSARPRAARTRSRSSSRSTRAPSRSTSPGPTLLRNEKERPATRGPLVLLCRSSLAPSA